MSDDLINKAFATQIANIEKSTNKKLAEWGEIISTAGLSKHGDKVKFLKEEHGFSHGNANTVVHFVDQTLARSEENTTDWIAVQYKGKEDLKKWYDKIVAAISGFGNDIEIVPKKTYTSLRRKKQFAIIQPSTKTRLDVGLILKGVAPSDKVEDGKKWNPMCTHRIKVEDGKTINKDLFGWIKQAYDQAG
jgi:predicted transport protein